MLNWPTAIFASIAVVALASVMVAFINRKKS